MRNTLLLASIILLPACATVSSYDRAMTPLPGAFEYAPERSGAAMSEMEWWRAFGDERLDALIRDALAGNLDLEAGVARLRQARASLQAVNASLLPQVSGGASASSDTERGLDDVSASARASASWQLDLFGQNRANRAAARATYESQVFNQRALELAIQSEAAFAYFSTIALRERLVVARSNLDISERIFEIVRIRYEAGDVSGFDMASQQASIANARARIPQLEQQLAAAEMSLAILLGRVPEGYRAPEGDLLALTPPEVHPGLPSELLLRRPDLLGAEASLRAADANVAAARAAFFPSIDLSGGVATALTGGTNLVGSLAGSLAAPIFSGGRLEASLEGARGRVDEQVANYRRATLNALRDVETGLMSLATAEGRERHLTSARDASARALELAEIRYRTGADDLTSLLNAQATYFSASDSLVQGRLDRLTAATDLFVAIGGGWRADS